MSFKSRLGDYMPSLRFLAMLWWTAPIAISIAIPGDFSIVPDEGTYFVSFHLLYVMSIAIMFFCILMLEVTLKPWKRLGLTLGWVLSVLVYSCNLVLFEYLAAQFPLPVMSSYMHWGSDMHSYFIVYYVDWFLLYLIFGVPICLLISRWRLTQNVAGEGSDSREVARMSTDTGPGNSSVAL